MSIFSRPKKKEELILVFNIGSFAVEGALFLTQESGIPKIIFSTRELIQIEKKVNIDRLLVLVTQSLEIVVNKIYMAKLGAPSKIFCILCSPWHASEARIISLKKNTPFIFTEKLANELIQKEINIFEENYSKKFKNANYPVRKIELKNIKTMLNGYETSNPLYQKAKELEMTIFISISGEQVLRRIENIISHYFHFNQIKFSSFVIAAFTVVRDLHTLKDNFLLVDISGEMTDISMVKQNSLRESISFPIGRNFLTRGIASGLSCSLGEANSLISLFKDGHAEVSENKELISTLNKLKTEWLKNFQDSLSNLSNDISIPATIYIAIDEDLENFFAETIKTEQFNQYTLTESKFEIVFLDSKLLHGAAVFEDSVIREPFLIIDSIYINRFLAK